MKQITIMVVDDSAVAREIVSELLSRDPAVKGVIAVADPIYAMQRMTTHWPDVIVLDVEMPRMDGITFLKRIMEERPTPVVICSTLTARGAETTVQALAAGAFAVVPKPRLGMKELTPDASSTLLEVVKAAAQARMSKLYVEKVETPLPSPPLPLPRHALAETSRRVVAIGTSTGGTLALERVLSALPGLCPGVVVVQHMLESHTRAFAARLNSICRIDVREARHGDMVTPGLALIAPGGRHMQVSRSGTRYRIEVSDGPRVTHHRPSVDVLFRSVARHAGPNALGVIMTGMGADGAQGLLEMREAGARTIAQDEESCVVFGMPREAIRRGGAESVMPLDSIAARIAAQAWPALPSPTP